MPVTGQCKTDPVSGVAGDIWNAIIGDGDNGLAAITLVSGSFMRKLVGTVYGAVAAAIVNNVPATGAHTDGAAVSWTQGTGAGQVSFPACPNASAISASGCDEGGVVTFTSGTGTTTGAVFTVHFKAVFTNIPAVVFFPANDAAAHLLFSAEFHVTSSTSAGSLNTASGISPLSNTTYSFHWVAKGSA